MQHREPFGEIVVTAGPLNQPYQPLGSVHVDTTGTMNLGVVLSDAITRSRLATAIQASPTATNEQMNEKLKMRAREVYGGRVNAIINVTYNTNPSGDVFADGLAVQFTQEERPTQASPVKPSTQERLDEIKQLLEKGYITRKEYDQKREAILKEL